ncbi:MAG TPA: hypothetical protein VNW30_03645 [Opitutaceae bacterium]|jgi:hypothetical protein|nr:hypothetical protein [Opitutaceae bacterium]
MSPQDPLDDLLDRWNPACPDTSGLQREVWQRIAATRPGALAQLVAWFRRPALSLSFVAACVLGVLAFVEWHEARFQRQMNAEFARQYLRVIDPMLGAPTGSDSMDRELVWMRDELRLSPVQYARIKKLHEALNAELAALQKERLSVRQETAALEEERRTEGQVDFLVFAGLIKTRQNLDLQSFNSMQRLVSATATIMTPKQRQRYLDYVQAAISTPPQPIAD